MGQLADDLGTEVAKIFSDQWETRDGQKVPEASDIALGNHAVKLSGTVLYADLADSTDLVRTKKKFFAAEVYKAYLISAARVIRARGGKITAYDGDRIMAVFIGDAKNSEAAKCGLQINWAVKNIVQPALKKQYPKSTYAVAQTVGIDTADLWVARTGIRGSNDLVWVGNAANYAAKMSSLDSKYPTVISKAVYDMLNKKSKFGGNPERNMWTNLGSSDLGVPLFGSTFWWSI